MKTIIFSLLILFALMGTSYSQTKDCCEEKSTAGDNTGKPECCEEKSSADETTAPNVMASFSNDQEFRDAHPTPLAFTLTGGTGNMITFKTSDGIDANGYEVRSTTPTNKWILVFHEWYGLNDYIKKESEEIALMLGSVNVLAVDLYDGKVATNNEEASKYIQSVDNKRAVTIIMGAKDYAGTGAVFGTMGWCFGGSWSNQAAIELGSSCTACVIYYGMPEQNKERLTKQKAPVLGIFAGQDKKITTEVVAKFEEDLKSLDISASMHIYDAVHGFANPSNPKHDAASTKDAKEKTYSFLKDKMK